MFTFFPQIKNTLAITGAIGVGSAVCTHWEDIKIIAGNLDEVWQGCAYTMEQIRQKVKRRSVARVAAQPEEEFEDWEGFASDSEVDDDMGERAESESDPNANPDHSSDSSTSVTVIINYSSNCGDNPDNATARHRTEPTADSSQPSMPNSHNFEGWDIPSESGTDFESELTGMSDISIISSDEEFR